MIVIESTPLTDRAATPPQRAFFAMDRVVIGRVSTADFVIVADTISRAAVHLLVSETRLTLVDRSDNGSYVNGVHGWGEREVQEGDVIELLPYRLAFRRPTAADLEEALSTPRPAGERGRIHEGLAILETGRTARQSGHAKLSAEAYADATGDRSVRDAVDAYATVFRVSKSNGELLGRLRAIRETLTPVLGDDHPFLGHVLVSLVGHMREMPEANAERLVVYAHLREVAERRYGPDHGATLSRLADEAWLRWATGDEDAAYRDFERVLVGFLRLGQASAEDAKAYWTKVGEIIRPFGAIARARGDAERVLPYEEALLAGQGEEARFVVEHLRLTRAPDFAFSYSARCLLRATEVVAPEWLPLAQAIVDAVGEAERRDIQARIRAARGEVPATGADDEPLAEGLILEGLDELVTLSIDGRPALTARAEVYGEPRRPGNYGLAAISAFEESLHPTTFGEREVTVLWDAQHRWERALFDELWAAREAARIARIGST